MRRAPVDQFAVKAGQKLARDFPCRLVISDRTLNIRQREGRIAACFPWESAARAKFGPRAGCKDCGRGLALLQSRTDSEVISPTAMAGGNTGLVLCQVGGQ